MKDLDKIKELVATCDSTNIELAIALGVNMEGYNREVLEGVISKTLEDNWEDHIKIDPRTFTISYPIIYGVMFLTHVCISIYVTKAIDSYLSL